MLNSLINKKIQHYLFKKHLGNGNFGSVYLVQNTSDSTYAACKMISKLKIKQNPKLIELINNEICVLFNCKSKNIVNYICSFEDKEYVYIVMQYCDGGDLDEYVKKKGGKLEENEAKYYVKEILAGFKALRSIGGVHRDFKLQNVLIHQGGIKIADMGFSKILGTDQKAKTILGTLYTMAPEIINNEEYGTECDIWSVGIVYYKMLYGEYPYMGINYAEMNKLIKSKSPNFHPEIPVTVESKDFITRCLVIDPKKRITWGEMEKHALFLNSMLASHVNPHKAAYLTKISTGSNNSTNNSSLLKEEDLPNTREYYIRKCGAMLKIQGSNMSSSSQLLQLLQQGMTKQLELDPIDKKIAEKRLNIYYYNLFIYIRQYIVSRIISGVTPIRQLINIKQLQPLIPLQQHNKIGFILARETTNQMTNLFNCINNKQNILDFKHGVKQFFTSPECLNLLEVFKNDEKTLANYVTQFKGQISKEEITRLEIGKDNDITVERLAMREKRCIIQYAILLFNNIGKFEQGMAAKVLGLVGFLVDEMKGEMKKGKVEKGKEEELKTVWERTKEMLTELKKAWQ